MAKAQQTIDINDVVRGQMRFTIRLKGYKRFKVKLFFAKIFFWIGAKILSNHGSIELED